ncbi:hypothetical protein F5146DRAFT_49546 [Armillaria mellea]|nr:hypothetical protein F5146DRAFT_49546 [Armillaria mellea]
MREKALEGDIIKDNGVAPRRALDLYSHRVVSWWAVAMLIRLPRAVSHAWTDKKDREPGWTRINGKQWPVSLPSGVDLRLLHNEWLYDGCQYVWVDLFCNRVSSYPIDRIAGLAYIYQGTQASAYYKSQTEEEAWLKPWRVSSMGCRAQMFFFFPQPGRGEQKWCPTWEQVLSEGLPVAECDPTEKWYGRVYYEVGPGPPFSFIKDGYVCGLAKDDPSVRVRSGELRIIDGSGTTHTFRILQVTTTLYPKAFMSYGAPLAKARLLLRYGNPELSRNTGYSGTAKVPSSRSFRYFR